MISPRAPNTPTVRQITAAAAFGIRGRPGWSPSRLALVTVLRRVVATGRRREADARPQDD
jgi:hypothetical protein